MRIAIASGKGGAGKTTVAASLAAVWDSSFVAVDTDVEAPNLHLFLSPEIRNSETVALEVPVLKADRCTACGACRDICRYKALALFGNRLAVFPDMCHGCGGCFAVCPEQALEVGARELGVLEEGIIPGSRGRFLMGRSRIGEAMTPPLLRALQRHLDRMPDLQKGDALLDSPPGVSCPAMTVVRDADLILLVAEPTPFGLYDFRLAHMAFEPLRKPMAVVINRIDMPGNESGDQEARRYCAEQGLPVLAELPFERTAAEAYARGNLLAHVASKWRTRFETLRTALRAFATEVRHA